MSMLVRRREAAKMIGVSTRTLARWHEAGVLRSRRVGPRLMVYDLADLKRFAHGDVAENAADSAGVVEEGDEG